VLLTLSKDIRIREITIADAAAFTECLHLTNQEAGTAGQPIDIREVRRLIKAACSDSGKNIFVAEEEGRIVGYSCVIGGGQPSDRHKGVFRIVLLQAYRGRKLGSRLTKTALLWARQQGFPRVELSVLSNNHVAQLLYQKCGFAVEGVKRCAFFDGKDYHDEIIMGLLFDSSFDRDHPAGLK
jgi:RimJ/RimL family protein N-acetyltransferase